MPKLLYNVTTGVVLITTSLVVTLLWCCSEILSLQAHPDLAGDPILTWGGYPILTWPGEYSIPGWGAPHPWPGGTPGYTPHGHTDSKQYLPHPSDAGGNKRFQLEISMLTHTEDYPKLNGAELGLHEVSEHWHAFWLYNLLLQVDLDLASNEEKQELF